jgi:hypothetical protein
LWAGRVLPVGLVLAFALAGCAGGTVEAGPGALDDVRAVAATPDGRLWVVDASGVAVLGDGIVARLGGVGTGAEAFLDPVDVDPTNGQAIYVADRGAGAVLQFTAEARLAASFPVYDVDPTQPLRQPGSARERTRAQPVAVAAGLEGALYVLDGSRRHVLRLDSEGAVERVLGAGVLVDPVDVAVGDDGTLWVADAGAAALRGFDPFGALGPVIAIPGTVGRPVGIDANGAGLVISGTRGVMVVRDGAAEVVPLDPSWAPLRGAVRLGDALVGVTASGVVTVGDIGRD